MKILHTIKSGKINEIELENVGYTTRHVEEKGQIRHEGWAVKGEVTEKGHKYILLFTVEEAKEFHKWLGQMLPRFETTELAQFITAEAHDDVLET